MQQPPLFVESINDALREVVRACGGPKVVGCRIWPEKSPDAAARTLADCLNDARAEKLSPDQVLLLARMGRERGCHAVVEFFASECGYAPPQPIEPEDERAALYREYVEATKVLAHLAARLDRIEPAAASITAIRGR
ncbi:MAG: hypothetical protein WCK28_00220 [Burkholderiales bacterium]